MASFSVHVCGVICVTQLHKKSYMYMYMHIHVHIHVASYPGPSQEKGEGLVYTVCTCMGLSQVYMGYPFFRGFTLHNTNLLPELFVLPRLDHSVRYVKQVIAIPQKPGIIPCMCKCIPGSLPSRARGLDTRLITHTCS